MLAGGALAVAGLMAAYSYSQATVNNPVQSLSVVTTDQATLALIPNPGPDNNVTVPTTGPQAGELVFNFDNGFGGGAFGIQPNSTYTWDDLFTVKNNSNAAVNVSVQAPEANVTDPLSVQFSASGAYSTILTFPLASGASQAVSVQLHAAPLPNNGSSLETGRASCRERVLACV